MNSTNENYGDQLQQASFETIAEREQYGEQLKQVAAIFIPLALSLPQLRDDPSKMHESIKATADSGITDVVTDADVYMQDELKKQIATHHPDWQFWGEEGEDRITKYDNSKSFLFITDPIEGTNNFKARKDGNWGSVVSLVDISTKEPVVGLVADPINRRVYLGIKGGGAFVVDYTDDGSIASFTDMPLQAEAPEFTYNNSPHFEPPLIEQIERFFSLGNILPDNPDADELEKSRKRVTLQTDESENTFVDPESGALEAVRNRGTIYFKTSSEMAAVFVILNELGGKVSDAEGNAWTLGIHTLIASRDASDYDYLLGVYNSTLV